MIDRWIYKFFAGLDIILEEIIPSIYERLKNIRIFSKRKRNKR